MADLIWYRGEAAGGPVSQPGGSIHDFGDGTYLADKLEVARMYAKARAPGQPSRQSVLIVSLKTSELGCVLDLRTDSRWSEFFRKTPGGSMLLELIKTGRMNENYGRAFDAFLDTYAINRNSYDSIIGPEYVRGGNQLCLVHKAGRPTPLVQLVRSRLRAVTEDSR